ncbi:MAG TPA: hypothetical protein VL382_11535, partial [Terriglobales bacterium]|nr:hypothetical protein [Terriglobales bacterium]
PAMAGAAAHLFRPANAVRIQSSPFDGTPLPLGTPVGQNPANGALIDYFLRSDSAQPVVLEIYDHAGKLVRRYSSGDKPVQLDPKELDIPAVWIKPPAPLSTAAGMHRFVWDLRWTAPLTTRSRREYLGPSGPWAVPGSYTLKLTADGQTLSQPLVVVLDPRVHTALPDLQAQFDAAQQVDGMIGQTTQARQQASHLHEQLQQLHTSAASSPDVVAAADALDRQLMAVLGTATRFGQPASEDFTSLEYLGRALPDLAGSISGAPVAPTRADLAAMQTYRRVLDAALAGWSRLKTAELPQLNGLLKQKGLPAVE